MACNGRYRHEDKNYTNNMTYIIIELESEKKLQRNRQTLLSKDSIRVSGCDREEEL